MSMRLGQGDVGSKQECKAMRRRLAVGHVSVDSYKTVQVRSCLKRLTCRTLRECRYDMPAAMSTSSVSTGPWSSSRV